jgi:hypothetical protein
VRLSSRGSKTNARFNETVFASGVERCANADPSVLLTPSLFSTGDFMRSLLLFFLGIPIPVIILIALLT